jgi:hypothetical protein
MKKTENQKLSTTKIEKTSATKQVDHQVKKSIQAAYMQASTKNVPEQ